MSGCGKLYLDEGEQEAHVDRLNSFKSTPVHSTAFKARRLPRAYLILLESLLNPSPSGRPSCEKVVSAVRMGQVRTPSFASGFL